MNTLIIPSKPACHDERTYNGLRPALALASWTIWAEKVITF
jgi:hypothetical protein